MSLKHGLLGLIEYGPISGYELHKHFEGSLNYFWQAQSSQIYRELKAMEQNGWVEVETIIQHDKPNKKLYTITSIGRSKLLEWLQEDVIDPPRLSFLMRVFFAGDLSYDQAVTLFNQYIDEQMSLLKDMEVKEQCKTLNLSKVSMFWDFTVDYGKASALMGIEWANACINKINERMR